MLSIFEHQLFQYIYIYIYIYIYLKKNMPNKILNNDDDIVHGVTFGEKKS